MTVERLVCNRQGSIRYAQWRGDNYIVVPMVMLVEGVHAGSNGPLYYTRNDLRKSPAAWNFKPVVIEHPVRNGEPVTACSMEVVDTQGVGLIMNAEYEHGSYGQPGRLKAEAWLEIDRLRKLVPDVLQRLESGEPVELSTGLFTDNDESRPGTFNGKDYVAIATNHRPDHLAILPGKEGACSLKSGCGLGVNESTEPCGCDKCKAKRLPLGQRVVANGGPGVIVEDEDSGEFVLYSDDGSTKLGSFPTRDGAERIQLAYMRGDLVANEITTNTWSDAAREASALARKGGAVGKPAIATDHLSDKGLAQLHDLHAEAFSKTGNIDSLYAMNEIKGKMLERAKTHLTAPEGHGAEKESLAAKRIEFAKHVGISATAEALIGMGIHKALGVTEGGEGGKKEEKKKGEEQASEPAHENVPQLVARNEEVQNGGPGSGRHAGFGHGLGALPEPSHLFPEMDSAAKVSQLAGKETYKAKFAGEGNFGADELYRRSDRLSTQAQILANDHDHENAANKHTEVAAVHQQLADYHAKRGDTNFNGKNLSDMHTAAAAAHNGAALAHRKMMTTNGGPGSGRHKGSGNLDEQGQEAWWKSNYHQTQAMRHEDAGARFFKNPKLQQDHIAASKLHQEAADHFNMAQVSADAGNEKEMSEHIDAGQDAADRAEKFTSKKRITLNSQTINGGPGSGRRRGLGKKFDKFHDEHEANVRKLRDDYGVSHQKAEGIYKQAAAQVGEPKNPDPKETHELAKMFMEDHLADKADQEQLDMDVNSMGALPKNAGIVMDEGGNKPQYDDGMDSAGIKRKKKKPEDELGDDLDRSSDMDEPSLGTLESEEEDDMASTTNSRLERFRQAVQTIVKNEASDLSVASRLIIRNRFDEYVANVEKEDGTDVWENKELYPTVNSMVDDLKTYINANPYQSTLAANGGPGSGRRPGGGKGPDLEKMRQQAMAHSKYADSAGKEADDAIENDDIDSGDVAEEAKNAHQEASEAHGKVSAAAEKSGDSKAAAFHKAMGAYHDGAAKYYNGEGDHPSRPDPKKYGYTTNDSADGDGDADDKKEKKPVKVLNDDSESDDSGGGDEEGEDAGGDSGSSSSSSGGTTNESEEVKSVPVLNCSCDEGSVEGGDAGVSNAHTQTLVEGVSNMDRKQKVDHLIANGGWDEADRTMLMAKNDKFLDMQVQNSVKPPENTPAVKPKPATTNAAGKTEQQEIDEYIQSAPAPIRNMYLQNLAQQEAERNRLVEIVCNAPGSKFNKEYVQTKMDIDVLRGIAGIVGHSHQTQNEFSRAPMYALAGGGMPVLATNSATVTANGAGEAEEPLGLPSMQFEKRQSQARAG